MSKSKAKLSSSLEDYLESIYLAVQQKGAARPKDLVARLGVTAASVTGALRQLAEKKLIHYAPYEVITLTETGQKQAEEILRKHDALCDFFTNVLDVPRHEAEEFACKMEHIIPDHLLARFIGFAEFVDRCPNSGAIWRGGAKGYFCKTPDRSQPLCKECRLEDDA